VIVEGAGSGTDRVRVATSFTLAAGAAIEVLETLAINGVTAINLTGNDAFQTLVGNAGDNILNGGEGADTMIGGLGDDTFIVDDQGDEVTEGVGGGVFDTVRTSVNFALDGGANIEVLAAAAGTAAIVLTGNALAQTVRGNGGANVLNGLSGTDTLTGGSGADTFVFSAALATTGLDTITDFSRAMDVIHLQNSVFTGLSIASGPLTTAAFAANLTGAAARTTDRIIYETDTGILRYDSNGSASGGTIVQFARLTTPLALDHTDFMVI
jgi:Ca2+-binding RTX toxin-like protein